MWNLNRNFVKEDNGRFDRKSGVEWYFSTKELVVDDREK